MPEDIKPAVEPQDLNAETKKNNDDVSRKLVDQKLEGQIDVNKETGDVLDALLGDVQGKGAEADAEKAAAEEKAAADKKVADDKAAADAAIANDPEKKAEAEKVAAETAAKADAEKKKVDEIFKDTPALPAGASPKSSEAFATVKIKAAQEISARDQKITELEAKVKDYEAKLQNPVPDEVKKEMDELRQWRAKLDMEVDPKFKAFDQAAESAREFIYAQLKKSPQVSDEAIEKIKKLGGPENVKLEKIFEAIADPTIQRLVEVKIAEIESTKFEKDKALKVARENVTGYLAEKQKSLESVATKHNADTFTHLETILPKLDYLAEKQVPAGADAATKASIEAHNKFAKETLGYMQAALNDDSAQMRAVMITGMAQLLHVKPQLAAATAKVAKLEKELKEATDKIEKFKGASVSRLRDSAVPPGGKLPEAKNDIDINVRPGDALDAIAKRVQEETARAAGNK